jgi:hypothetical protein
METYIMFVGGTVEVKSTRRFANHDSLQLPCHLTSYYYTDNMLHSFAILKSSCINEMSQSER